jgi:DNA-binding transcriptional ArsR family regulator
MVKYSSNALDQTFGALSDPTRRAILKMLANGERTVTELAEPFRITLPAISKHLRVLENAGLLKQEKEGRLHRCQIIAKPLQEASEWIAHYRAFWEQSFDRLDEYLYELQKKEKKRGRKK